MEANKNMSAYLYQFNCHHSGYKPMQWHSHSPCSIDTLSARLSCSNCLFSQKKIKL